MSLDLAKDKRCFVCGVENPHSLKVKVEQEGENQVKAEFVADDRYRGWSNYLHGGILSLIFDEMLSQDLITAQWGLPEVPKKVQKMIKRQRKRKNFFCKISIQFLDRVLGV